MSTTPTTASSNEPWLERHLSHILLGILAVAAFAIAVVVAFYVCNFSSPLSSDTEAWGQFGDYIGGTLNPLLSFLALIGLLFTLWIQSRSLSTARRQMAQQNEVTSLSAQISGITALVSSLNDQIDQDNVYTSAGGHNHLEANRQRLARREALFQRLDKVYERLADIQHAG